MHNVLLSGAKTIESRVNVEGNQAGCHWKPNIMRISSTGNNPKGIPPRLCAPRINNLTLIIVSNESE